MNLTPTSTYSRSSLIQGNNSSAILSHYSKYLFVTKNHALLSFKASAEDTLRDNGKDIGFELLGFDFMIDTDLNVKLIEVNQNPCLSTLSEPQGVLITKLLNDVFR